MKSQVVSQNLGMGAFAKSEIPCSTALRHGKFWLTVNGLAMVGHLENVSPTFAQMPDRITNVESTTVCPTIAKPML
jgi:hypothetical protein